MDSIPEYRIYTKNKDRFFEFHKNKCAPKPAPTPVGGSSLPDTLKLSDCAYERTRHQSYSLLPWFEDGLSTLDLSNSDLDLLRQLPLGLLHFVYNYLSTATLVLPQKVGSWCNAGADCMRSYRVYD